MDLKKLAVVMNPPYQIQSEAQRIQGGNGSNGGAKAKPLYHKFIEMAIDYINVDYLVSINPSKWMIGGMGLDKFRKRMIHDKRIKSIAHYKNSDDIFPSVNLKGGVNYFLWDASYSGECSFSDGGTTYGRYLSDHDTVVMDNNSARIISSVATDYSDFVSSTCLPVIPFGLLTNFNNWSDAGAICFTAKKVKKLVDPSLYTDRHGVLDKFKVSTSALTSEGNLKYGANGDRKVISQAFIIPPGEVCTQTYIVVNSFDACEEAENFTSYMKTKFFRFMLGTRVVTPNVTKQKFSFVPDLIDYTRSYTDEELYEMFNLTEEQQAYIESKIKPLE